MSATDAKQLMVSTNTSTWGTK